MTLHELIFVRVQIPLRIQDRQKIDEVCTAMFERMRPPVNKGKLIPGPAEKKLPAPSVRS